MSSTFRASCGATLVTALAGTIAALSVGTVREPDIRTVGSLLDRGDFERAEIAARAAWSDVRRRHAADSLAAARAADNLVRALFHNGKAAGLETQQLAQRTLRTRVALQGSEHPDIVPTLINLGYVLSGGGEHARAIAHLEKALFIVEQTSNSPELERADVLDALGIVLTDARRYEAALEVLQLSRKVREQHAAGDEAGLHSTLLATVAVLQRAGQYREAREILDRTLGSWAQATAPLQIQVRAHNLLALQFAFEGELVKSRTVSLQVLEVAEKTLRSEHPLIAETLRVLAGTIDDLGDIEGARACRLRALDVARKSLGDTHFQIAGYLNDVGTLELLAGNYTAARTTFEAALDIAKARLDPTHDWIPMLLHNLALVDAGLGDFRAARRKHARAIELWEHALGPDHAFVAFALSEMASVLREQGAVDEALALLKRALWIRERRHGTNHPDTARTQADIAAALAQTGDYEGAHAAAARALSFWEHTDAVDAPELATVLELYARLLLDRGQYAEARQYFERGLTIRRRAFGDAHPRVADLQASLALADASLGRIGSALGAALQAETRGLEHLRLMLRHLPERQSLNYASTRPKGRDLILSLAGHSSAATALDITIRGRALVLDEMAARRQTATEPGDSLAPLRTALIAARQRLANVVVRGPSGLSSDQYLALVEQAHREKEDAERALAARSRSFVAELSRARAGLAEVRRALPAEGVLVSFVRYSRTAIGAGRTERTSSPGRRAPPVDSYLAFVLRSNADPVAIDLGPAVTVDDLVAKWRADLAAAALSPPAADLEAHRRSGQKLRAAVWDPLQTHLNGARLAFIVPDGTLSLVAFAALPGLREEFVLEEGPVLHLLSAERDLLLQPQVQSSTGLLALGGPQFDDAGVPTATRQALTRADTGAGGRCDFRNLAFGDLAGTLREVQEIADVWASHGGTGASNLRVLTAADASERIFKGEAARHRVLHLATHGFFLGDSCGATLPSQRGVGTLVTHGRTGLDLEIAGTSPLLLSGLALAGANQRRSRDVNDDDGILTAEEVVSLDLANVEWAVLSACDTGRGEIKSGEGVLGLRRAFQIAGARTVIMSLWSVDDDATREWMRALYEGRLERRLNTAQAVREASLTVLRARRAKRLTTHPFYWAAFVAAGDWR